MPVCLACESDSLKLVMDLGMQPVASRFRDKTEAEEPRHPMGLAICRRCGILQLPQPWPASLLKPTVPMLYREPEDHLDSIVSNAIARLPLAEGTVIAGASYKDDTLLARFRAACHATTWRLDPQQDLGISDPTANIETFQGAIRADRIAGTAAVRGKADLVVLRHILEHAEQPRALIEAASTLLKPEGRLLIEVPDCTKSLRLGDITMLWEEHALYLTPATMPRLLGEFGYVIEDLQVHPYPFEDLIVVIAHRATGHTSTASEVADGEKMVEHFSDQARFWMERYRAHLSAVKSAGRGIALFGAGHLSTAFVNYNGLADLISHVIDDTPAKQGRYLAGTGIPIVPAQAMAEMPAELYLLGLSPKLEDNIVTRIRAADSVASWIASIFAESERSLRKIVI